MEKLSFEYSLGNETKEALGFKIIDELENELDSLT